MRPLQAGQRRRSTRPPSFLREIIASGVTVRGKKRVSYCIALYLIATGSIKRQTFYKIFQQENRRWKGKAIVSVAITRTRASMLPLGAICCAQQAPAAEIKNPPSRASLRHISLGIVLGHQHQFRPRPAYQIAAESFSDPPMDPGMREFLPVAAHQSPAHTGVLCLAKRDTPVIGARGAHGTDEVRDAPARLLPDLRPVVSKWMRGLSAFGELSSTLPSPCFLHGLARSRANSMPPPLRGEHQLGTKGLMRACARSIDKSSGITSTMWYPLDGSRHGQRNAGVARGGLDQRIVWPDVPHALGPADHVRRTVLHRPRRVIASSLPKMTLLPPRQVVPGANAAVAQSSGVLSPTGVLDRSDISHAPHCAHITWVSTNARRVAELLVDAGDLQNPRRKACRFDSGPGHHRFVAKRFLLVRASVIAAKALAQQHETVARLPPNCGGPFVYPG